MAIEPFVKGRLASTSRGCALQLLGVGAGVASLAAVTGGVGLLVWLELVPLAIAVPLALVPWAVTVPVAAVLVLLVVIGRRGRRLDTAFPVAGSQVGPVTRGWSWTIDGRQAHAWFTRGPQLELYLAGDVGTRAGLGPDTALGRAGSAMVGAGSVDLPPTLQGLELAASGANPDWVRRWLEDPGVAAGVDALFGAQDAPPSLVTVGPDYLKVSLRYLPLAHITAERVEAWLQQLQALADGAERVAPPAERQEPTRVETLSRRDRAAIFRRVALGAGCLVVGVFAVGLVPILAVFLLP